MIDGLTYFAWGVMAMMLIIVTTLFVFLGSLPKKIADKHNHPQADAINAASWLGLFMGGIGWPFALVWAYTNSGNAGYSNAADEGVSQDTPASPRTKTEVDTKSTQPASEHS
jgi:hypothetical protein